MSLLLASVLFLSSPAVAQDAPDGGFDAHGFRLAAFDGDVRDGLYVVRPGTFHRGDHFLGAIAEYARDPLILESIATFSDERTARPAIRDLIALNVSAGWSPIDWIRLDVSLPAYVSTTGASGQFQGVDLGDPRLSLMVPVLRPRHVTFGGGFGLALMGHIDGPIGGTRHFLGNRGLVGGGGVAATYDLERFTAFGNLGATFRSAVDVANYNGSDALTMGLGLNFVATPSLGVTWEAHTTAPLVASTERGSSAPAETLLSMRYRHRAGGTFVLGGATALSRGVGAAAFRVFIGGGWGKMQPLVGPDSDTEGMFSSVDRCPSQRETVNGWQDDDGCPDGLGMMSVRTDYAGEPVPGARISLSGPKGTVERVADTGQFAIEEAMPGSTFTATASAECLEGRGQATAVEGPSELVISMKPVYRSALRFEVHNFSGEVLAGAHVQLVGGTERCLPRSELDLDDVGSGLVQLGPGTYKAFVSAEKHNLHEETVTVADGETRVVRVALKQTKVRLEYKRIVILDKVFFETNKAVIKPESFELLDEVAATINANPQVGRVEVAGHTDSDGSDRYNEDLSQRRAESVVAYLVNKGCWPERLIALGYGESRPIATNATADGKAENRRVEFNLIDQKDPADEGVESPEAP